MELLIYTRKYNEANAIHNFMDFYHSLQMSHLASDLLDRGLSPKQISEAVAMALKIANALGIETKAHFMPVFSGIDHDIIQDCKLSHLGYGLVLMNADANLSVVGEFQVDVLNNYLDNTI
jgi:hypothetical protein